MGESTANKCLRYFTDIVSNDYNLNNDYMRQMTREDARKASELHETIHGVPGMIGSLDCMHVYWRSCPTAWQGQYQGGKGKPTIILEAYADHYLWIWHATFSSPGSLNDINVWDQSPLLRSFLDGTFAKQVDFEFTINGQGFHRVWLLVDGIYPELSRFVKTISEPGDKRSRYYAKWQEATRKDIERAFGVLQRKFNVLVRPVEQWYVEDITKIVETCIVLHNMMVEDRIQRDESEESNWYEYNERDQQDTYECDPEEEFAERRVAEINLHSQLQRAFYRGPAITLDEGFDSSGAKFYNDIRVTTVLRRWDTLHSQEEHFRLRNCIMDQLLRQSSSSSDESVNDVSTVTEDVAVDGEES